MPLGSLPQRPRRRRRSSPPAHRPPPAAPPHARVLRAPSTACPSSAFFAHLWLVLYLPLHLLAHHQLGQLLDLLSLDLNAFLQLCVTHVCLLLVLSNIVERAHKRLHHGLEVVEAVGGGMKSNRRCLQRGCAVGGRLLHLLVRH